MTTATTRRELTLTRVFDAPRQLVWDAYTVPEQLAKRWGPSIMHTPLETIAIELRSPTDGTRRAAGSAAARPR